MREVQIPSNKKQFSPDHLKTKYPNENFIRYFIYRINRKFIFTACLFCLFFNNKKTSHY